MKRSLTENRGLSSHRSSEFGQVLILIGIAFTAMLGLMALAIDGGRLFADRRQAQNTADAASFAGALVIAQADNGDPTKLPPGTYTEAVIKAFERAASNGFDDSDPDVDVSVNVSKLPLFGEGAFYYLVRVEITSRIDGMFTSLVYQGQLANTVYAVAKVKPVQGLGYGNSLYATAPDECNAILFRGEANVHIVDGGIFSNSIADTEACPSMHRKGDAVVEVVSGEIGSAGYYQDSGESGSISPSPSSGLEQQTLSDLPTPDCSGLPSYGFMLIEPGSTVTLQPGIYEGIELKGSDDNPSIVTMNEGMYCISTSGFTVKGATVFGEEIFIYLAGGNFLVTATSEVYFSAAHDLYDASGNFWGGMLLYMDANNTGTITLTGASGSQYVGTIWAVGPASPSSKPKCTVLGTGGVLSINSQIFCYTIDIAGSGNVQMTYDAAANFKLGSTLSQQE